MTFILGVFVGVVITLLGMAVGVYLTGRRG